jgi:PAS domain S-box-containing protein/putative nucleotidyltransferase with HDIG domain
MKKRLFLIVGHQPEYIDKFQTLLNRSFPHAKLLTSESGEEVMTIAQISYPDVILMNLKNASPDLCRRFKADGLLKTVPVIFSVSLQTSTILKQEALNSGGDGFLTEPFDEIELTALIQSMFRIHDISFHQERYRIMIESLPNTIGINDANGVVRYRSPNNEQLFGFKPDEVIGKPSVDLIHPEDRNRLRQTFKKILAGGESFALADEFRFNRKDGEELIIHLVGKNMVANPMIKGVLMSYKNITTQKKIEQELRESDERFNSMVRSMDDVIFTLDRNQRYTGIYGRWVNKNKLTEEAFIGKTSREIFSSGVAAIHEKYNQDALAGKTVIYEWILQNSDGKNYLQTSLSPMFDHNGNVFGIAGIGRDITRLKIAEAELERSEEQYRQAQEMGHIGHWQFNPVTNQFEGSPETLRIYGYPEHTFVDFDQIVSCISKKDYERNKNALYQVLEQGLPFDEELEIWPPNEKNARVIWAKAELRKIDDGKQVVISGILQDITERKRLEKVLKKQHHHMEITNRMLSQRLERSINAISKIGELRDMYTAGHQRKVANLSCAIAKEMGMSEEAIRNIYMGALIHDIGKIYIASDILNKPGKITSLEYQILQTHAENGYEVVKEIDFISQIPDMIYQHHERMDGSGYPRGLSGRQIILESRILAVADVVEAMSSHRPYRPALGIEAALNEIREHQGTKYDTRVLDICISLFTNKGYQFCTESEG